MGDGEFDGVFVRRVLSEARDLGSLFRILGFLLLIFQKPDALFSSAVQAHCGSKIENQYCSLARLTDDRHK